MNSLFLILWTLALVAKCKSDKELNDLCGEHTYQSISPILRYVDQLQEETREINDLRKKVKELDLKILEGKLKDDLIVRQENQIEDLQTTISELLKINLVLTQNVGSVGSESQEKLKENQDELVKQKHIILQKDQELSKLKEEIKKNEELPTICNTNFNGIRYVILPNIDPFPALCNSDIAGPGWTVIQQRINGGEDFFRNWETYKNGFGSFTGDFFLGLERIHRLTKDTPHELYIYMEAFEGGKVEREYKRNTFYARYDNFSIAGEDDKYSLLSLGSYSGNTSQDTMRYSENSEFSTFDRHNDAWEDDNCAEFRHAGWWYVRYCATSNLNGKYYQKEVVDIDSNWWFPKISLKAIKMMIRPRVN